MKITMMGTGYVGLVTGTCLAESGNHVVNVDIDEKKIQMLKEGKIPIYEPGLEDLVERNVKEGRLHFTTSVEEGVDHGDIIFLAVGTPSKADGSADLSYLEEAARGIGRYMKDYKIVVIKSTVPVGTHERIRKIIQEETNIPFDMVSNPEFLKEGTAVDDFMRPDRVVIGSSSEKAAQIMEDLYSPFVRTGHPILKMDNYSAEITKYAANAYLATRISFINEIALLCEKCNADVNKVRVGMGTDSRIGPRFLFPGLGFGGSCFPKDVRAIVQTGKDVGLELMVAEAALKVNQRQRELFLEKVLQRFPQPKGRSFAVWGLAFKPKTDDIREAPAIDIIRGLLEKGASISAYDPEAMENTRSIFGDQISYASNPYEACQDKDALLVITEWKEFHHPDFEKLKRLLKTPIIFDGRNIYKGEALKNMGFEYTCIGVGAYSGSLHGKG
ncbi:MAG: UDP-glucose/GDP-mannose dehydrogenase family protein [Planctomycetota bacterium]|nr:MAG: UDP-glucose/GDP-mannose dehydrogenase family protein [Planctomycetota bacterium]